MMLMINKQSGANTVDVARSVKSELERLGRNVPEASFEVVQDQSTFIERSINNLAESA